MVPVEEVLRKGEGESVNLLGCPGSGLSAGTLSGRVVRRGRASRDRFQTRVEEVCPEMVVHSGRRRDLGRGSGPARWTGA